MKNKNEKLIEKVFLHLNKLESTSAHNFTNHKISKAFLSWIFAQMKK